MRELQLSKAFTLIEPGPVVLVTTHDGQKDNIMTISWTMVMDFTPVFAITTGKWNHSFAALREQRECVIAISTVAMLDKVVGRGKSLLLRRLDGIFVISGAGGAVDIDAFQIGEFSWQLLHRAPAHQEGRLMSDH